MIFQYTWNRSKIIPLHYNGLVTNTQTAHRIHSRNKKEGFGPGVALFIQRETSVAGRYFAFTLSNGFFDAHSECTTRTHVVLKEVSISTLSEQERSTQPFSTIYTIMVFKLPCLLSLVVSAHQTHTHSALNMLSGPFMMITKPTWTPLSTASLYLASNVLLGLEHSTYSNMSKPVYIGLPKHSS